MGTHVSNLEQSAVIFVNNIRKSTCKLRREIGNKTSPWSLTEYFPPTDFGSTILRALWEVHRMAPLQFAQVVEKKLFPDQNVLALQLSTDDYLS